MNASKTMLIAIGAILVVGLILFIQMRNSAAPRTAPVAPDADANAKALIDGTYVVATDTSKLEWSGRKTLIANYTDTGTIGIKEGTITVKDGAVTGTIVMDMDTLATLTTGAGKGMDVQEKHMKSDDFFAVTKYPTATFNLTDAKPADDVATSHRYAVSGDLTIKDISKPVTFDAVIYMENGKLRTAASTSLDRTLWDIRYASTKFYGNLADKVIDDMFQVTFDVTAAAK